MAKREENYGSRKINRIGRHLALANGVIRNGCRHPGSRAAGFERNGPARDSSAGKLLRLGERCDH